MPMTKKTREPKLNPFTEPDETVEQIAKIAEENKRKLREAVRYATGEYMESPPEKDYT